MADNDGWTALHNAATNGIFELFLYILGKGSEIYRKTNSMRNVYEDNDIRNQYIY